MAVCVATGTVAASFAVRPARAYPPPDPRAIAYPTTGEFRTYTTTGPNTDLVASGVITLGIPYAISVVAATESSRPADNYLYTPVAGPWLDLANRGECPPTSACNNESANRALLIANGVLQGVGALQIISGFLFPVTRSVTVLDSGIEVHFVPQFGREGYGVTAVGTF
jgi:hypothetical protein